MDLRPQVRNFHDKEKRGIREVARWIASPCGFAMTWGRFLNSTRPKRRPMWCGNPYRQPSVKRHLPPSVIASGAKQSRGRTPLVWIASPTATVLPRVRNDGVLLSLYCAMYGIMRKSCSV
ncbi:MAG: hypothetical protein LBT00_15500 [Spirochaetaceae bacterium]|nr:hypothetical protein [Spirochaetaceae bacterium]